MMNKRFAIEFSREFKKTTSGLSSHEIPLFRALQKTLQSLSSRFHIEEYHGAKHQVKFSGTGSMSRARSRCELADLFIVIFSNNPISVRITFFQAKSERGYLKGFCPIGQSLNANLEQWDLLANRPTIEGCGKFNPPNNLLSKAILPSVGTFGFFNKKSPSDDYRIIYSTGDNLSLTTSGKIRYGKLAVQKCHIRSINGFYESTASCSIRQFGYNLVSNLIGTPIHHSADSAVPHSENPHTRSWLANVLKESMINARQIDLPTQLAEQLIGTLETDPDEYQNEGFGAKSMFLINSGNIG